MLLSGRVEVPMLTGHTFHCCNVTSSVFSISNLAVSNNYDFPSDFRSNLDNTDDVDVLIVVFTRQHYFRT
jgi:hypothetical protein